LPNITRNFDNFGLLSSGVARVPYALGQEIFLRPLPTKTTEFEVKNLMQRKVFKI